MDWVRENVNYWDNPKCPREYLEGALVRLLNEVEGIALPLNYFATMSEEELREQVEFYEYVSDK